MDETSRFDGLLTSAVAEYGLFEGEEYPLALMKGWVAVESNFRPYAIRYEPAFYDRYMVDQGHLGTTERRARAFSWGLLQIMGETARNFGYGEQYLSQLLDPVQNVSLAGRILSRRYEQIGTWDGALAAYNGGLRGNREPPYRRQAYADKCRAAAMRFED